jgi:hypothetical protein
MRRGLSRRAAIPFSVGALLCSIAGCAKLPVYQIEKLHPAADVAEPIDVRFDDRRPQWERSFYLGGSDAKDLQNAVTFIPAERLEPSPWEVLKSELAMRFAHVGATVTHVELTIRSCRLVVNQNLPSEQVEAERAAKRAKEAKDRRDQEERDRLFGREPEKDDESFGDAVGNSLAKSLFELMWYAAKSGTRHLAHAVHLRPGEAGPPSQIDMETYPIGATFEIAGSAVVTFADGTTKTVSLQHADFIAGRFKPNSESVQRVAAAGLAKAADQVVRQALDLPIAQESPPGAAAPSTAPSNASSLTPFFQETRILKEPAPEVRAEIERLEHSEVDRHTRLSRNER